MEGLSLEFFYLANSTTVLTTIPVDLPLAESSMKIGAALKHCDKPKEDQEQCKVVLLGSNKTSMLFFHTLISAY